MAKGSGVRPTGESLEVRYDRVRKMLVPKFLERHRLTVVGLARLIDVDRSSLTRFLNGTEGYTPTKSRPGKLEMLEKLEACCSQQNIRTQLDEVILSRRGLDGGPETDLDVMFRHFTERIHVLEEQYEPALALALLPEFCAHAMCAPVPYGASMSTNLLSVIMFLTDRDGVEDASERLLRETVQRVRKLESSRSTLQRTTSVSKRFDTRSDTQGSRSPCSD